MHPLFGCDFICACPPFVSGGPAARRAELVVDGQLLFPGTARLLWNWLGGPVAMLSLPPRRWRQGTSTFRAPSRPPGLIQ